MRQVALARAKAQLSALLDAVEAGEEVVITRRGKAVARLIADSPAVTATPAAPWPERLRQLRAQEPCFPRSAVGLVRELRDEG